MPEPDDLLVRAGVADPTVNEPEPWYVRLGAVAVADVDQPMVGRAASEDHSPILLLPRSDPAVRRFLYAVTADATAPGRPVIWLGYVPQAHLEDDTP